MIGLSRSRVPFRTCIGLGALVLTLGVIPHAPAAAASDVQQLTRYRPILRYDSREQYFAQPISRATEVIDRELMYGHVVDRGGERWLQYWFFYAANTQDRGVLRTGRHEGDWEFVQLRLGPEGEPATATFAQHSSAESCAYGDLELARVGGVDVARVYVANGSHASYPRAGTADRPWPDPNDEADGAGRQVRPEVMRISDEDPRWVADPAPWGSTRAGLVPGEQSSPPGPRFQPDGRWDDPAAYESAARPCGSEPPGRPWQTPATIAFGLLLVGLIARGRRKRKVPGDGPAGSPGSLSGRR